MKLLANAVTTDIFRWRRLACPQISQASRSYAEAQVLDIRTAAGPFPKRATVDLFFESFTDINSTVTHQFCARKHVGIRIPTGQ